MFTIVLHLYQLGVKTRDLENIRTPSVNVSLIIVSRTSGLERNENGRGLFMNDLDDLILMILMT